MEDPELTEVIVREMFEVTWVMAKLVGKFRQPSLYP
jgi:hypothetical protein